MTRHTSIHVYHQIRDEGLLSDLRFAVYEALYHHGPLTCKELARHLGKERDSVSPRMKELTRMGLLQEVGERMCTVSERMAVLWDVTSALPKTPDPVSPRARRQAPVSDDMRPEELSALKAIAQNYNPADGSPVQFITVPRAALEAVHSLVSRKEAHV